MRLLICTQKVDKNDSVLGFFHRWIEEFAKHAELVTVLCLEKGVVELPESVRVYSLGKDAGYGRLGIAMNFLRRIWSLRGDYDVVFVHMNPEYVVLGGTIWRALGKKITMWYTHRNVDLKLRVATFFCSIIFTAAKESFRISSRKVHIIGHGIDTEKFICSEHVRSKDVIRIISVGRITPIKNCEVLIHAAHLLKGRIRVPFLVEFIGTPVTKEDGVYAEQMRALVDSLEVAEIVSFRGSIPNRYMPKEYCSAHIAVNMTPPGGIDKAVLEAMVAGTIPLVSNTAFKSTFAQYEERLLFTFGASDELARKLEAIMIDDSLAKEISEQLSRIGREQYDVSRIVRIISDELKCCI